MVSSVYVCVCVCVEGKPIAPAYVLIYVCVCSDGGLVLKGLGRVIIPEVIRDREVGSSAGQERASTPAPPINPDPDNLESTAL